MKTPILLVAVLGLAPPDGATRPRTWTYGIVDQVDAGVALVEWHPATGGSELSYDWFPAALLPPGSGEGSAFGVRCLGHRVAIVPVSSNRVHRARHRREHARNP